jgi:hypothetical protein
MDSPAAGASKALLEQLQKSWCLNRRGSVTAGSICDPAPEAIAGGEVNLHIGEEFARFNCKLRSCRPAWGSLCISRLRKQADLDAGDCVGRHAFS